MLRAAYLDVASHPWRNSFPEDRLHLTVRRSSSLRQSDALLKRIQSIPYLAESDVAIEELGFTTDQIARLKSDRDRYVTKQAVAQAAQAAGLDLSGEPEVAE